MRHLGRVGACETKIRHPAPGRDPHLTTAETALRGESAPVGSSLREIAEAAAAYAEQQAIRRVLQVTNGNKSEAARLLRTDYKTLHLKMRQYSIPSDHARRSRQ